MRSSLSFNHAFITLILPQSLNPPFRRLSFMVTKPSKWSSPVTVEFIGLDNVGKITLFHMFKDEGRDLSPITAKLWKKFFENLFDTNSTNEVVKRMKEKKVSFKWIQLYEAKGKEMAQVENEALDRIKQLYKKEDAIVVTTKDWITAGKQSRQVRPCTKVPPSSKRRFCGGSHIFCIKACYLISC
ncbi:uncharacterized protein LOC106771701 isoform X2 [Vigna radiata var. radiata]|uniref:Uncharacterized protein LOC106771701 isoform X2 n=1 Tax=Vigna radiata var. radiata TaxID=3916 RepID=A0A3Q0FBJ1_VIGRR|nr:uncharacterized protein LOC106771701 isoform X2 [Vigna radiata var. radiata]XP_022641173.1 uncharacterized protein LOC106771701 isoform X2 [Vigna radiata var. radiata]